MLKRPETRIWIIFFIIVCMLTALAVNFGCRKEGYYIDELWSYGLANSYEMPYLQEKEGYMETWHQPDFYEQYLSVEPDRTFAWSSVYSNQIRDVHPPLYYILLHSISSLFPGKFSKWYGLSINLLFYIGTLCLLFELGGISDRGRKSYARLLAPVLYGVSAGALSTVIYIRMYMMLTCIVVLFAVLVWRVMTKEGRGYKINLISLMTASAVGILTQYYFLIFAFFLSVCYVFWRILRREWYKALSYALSVWLGIGLGILIFPTILRHILAGDKAQETFANAKGGFTVFFERLISYVRILSRAFWGGSVIWLCVSLLSVFACIAILMLSGYWKKIWIGELAKIYMCFMTVTVCAYFLVVVQISTDIVDRYQFLIYPFISLLMLYPVVEVCRLFRRESLVGILTGGYVFCCLFSYGKGNGMVSYLYPGYQDALRVIATEYNDVPGIYVTKGDHLVIGNCLFLSKQEMTYALTIEELHTLYEKMKSSEIVLSGEAEDRLVLYLDIYYQEDETAEEVCRLLGYRKADHLYDNQFTQIYALTK